MTRRKTGPVQTGDRFIKVQDANRKVWEVVAVATTVDGIEHARLQSAEGLGGSITIGSGVLCDHRFWQREQAA